MADRPQLLSGARGLIQRFNSETNSFDTLAFATDISVNIRAGVQTTHVMGRMNAGAIDSLSYDVDVSVGRVYPVNASNPAVAVQNPDGSITPGANNSAIAAGLETIIAQMVSAGDLNIALQDKVTSKYVSSVKGCRFAGRSLGVSAQGLANERLNFVGIYDSGYEGENSAPKIGYESSSA